jgi:hypothetical protein
MRIFARIDLINIVVELFETPDDKNITDYFGTALVWVEVTGMDPMPQQNWTYDDGVFTPPPPPPDLYPAEKAQYISSVIRLREQIFNRLALIAIIAYADDDMVVFNAIKTGRQALLDLPQHPSIEAATNITELRTAVKALYAAIVATVPPSLKDKFDEVDA